MKVNGLNYKEEEIPGKGKCLVPVPVKKKEEKWLKILRENFQDPGFLNKKLKFSDSDSGNSSIFTPIADYNDEKCNAVFSLMFSYTNKCFPGELIKGFGWHSTVDSFVEALEEFEIQVTIKR